MGNRSVYLDDDEDEWVTDNIDNLSDYLRRHIRFDMQKKIDEDLQEQRRRYIEFFVCIIFMITGIAVLIFSILLHLGGFNQLVTLDYGTLLGLISGIILEGFAIKYMFNYKKKNGVEK